jgi:hypothetical protein
LLDIVKNIPKVRANALDLPWGDAGEQRKRQNFVGGKLSDGQGFAAITVETHLMQRSRIVDSGLDVASLKLTLHASPFRNSEDVLVVNAARLHRDRQEQVGALLQALGVESYGSPPCCVPSIQMRKLGREHNRLKRV